MRDSYFYPSDHEAFEFIMVPKALYEDAHYKGLPSGCVILYSLMLNRVSLSQQNNWFDEQLRVYIFFTIAEIMKIFSCAREKAVTMLETLQLIGLVEKKRQGLGKPNRLYVKKFKGCVPSHSRRA
ncbi:MAG: replication initiator protein A [Oscillospiraceae bacterium]|nr:replication initiator protein A [Oscillospiraceae bacterium]